MTRVIMVPPTEKRRKERRRVLRLVALVALISLLFGITAGALFYNGGASAATPIRTGVRVNRAKGNPSTDAETSESGTENTVGPLSPVFHANVQRWAPLVREWAGAYDVDPNLIATIIQVESCGNPDAVSSAGARGLMQVMPYHFAAGENPFDPATNVRRGVDYFVQGLRSSGWDIGLAFAGYNGGHTRVQRGRWLWPDETVRYHRWTTGIFWDIKNGLSESPTIREWMRAGGASLCNA